MKNNFTLHPLTAPPPDPHDPEMQLQADREGPGTGFWLLVLIGWSLATVFYWWPRDFLSWVGQRCRAATRRTRRSALPKLPS